MLNIYYGRECLNKEAFLFSKIEESLKQIRAGEKNARRILLIVPAQFTLKAEEAAFSHLKAKGFFDLQIMSGNRLRTRILSEVGQTGKTPINSLGRRMLLRKIATEKKAKLNSFSNVVETDKFLSMTGDFIVQLKQNKVTPLELAHIAQRTQHREILKKKLDDMHTIYTAYQDIMQGKFNDSEDMLKAVCDRVQKSNYISTSEIWYYDFYSFVPSEIDFMRELIEHASDLNVLLTSAKTGDRDYDLFAPATRSIKALQKAAESRSVKSAVHPIGEEFKYDQKPDALLHVESQLYAMPCEAYHLKDAPLPIHIVRASTPYTESETIASHIKRLVREQHYSYDEIAVLTNDLSVRGAILGRVFSLNDIPFFTDEKRTLLHNPLIKTITSLLNIVSDHFKTEDVLQFLKSGLVFLSADIEEFENYVLQYHIKNNRFLTPFRYGSKALGEKKMLYLEKIRLQLERLIVPFKESFLNAPDVGSKSAILYQFLAQTLRLPDTLLEQSIQLSQEGMTDSAEETQQVWTVFLELLDQMVELLGDEPISMSDYRDILKSSFSDIKVGLLPQSEHKVLIGTVGRSRLPEVKALFIAGVNDGILPSDIREEGILTNRELSLLEQQGYSLSKSGQYKQEEERLTIYKAFSKPSCLLYTSYSVADEEGKELRPSSLIPQILAMFPQLDEEADIENEGSEIGFVQSKKMAISHLSTGLRKLISGEKSDLSPLLQQSYNILLDMKEPRLRLIKEGLFFSSTADPLSLQTTRDLYKSMESDSDENFSFSPSRLEKFAGCPFKHYVSYGLRPNERRPFEISGSEIGDIHHACMMRLSQDLTSEAKEKKLYVTHPDSPWMTITRSECAKRIETIIDTIAQESFEGLLQLGKQEKYRTKRIAEVSEKFAWNMIEHVRKEKVDEIFSEVSFGQDVQCTFPAVEIHTGQSKVSIEGKIDRVDLLRNSQRIPYVKIIDYKSGTIAFRKDKIERGLQLQLMIYLEGALGYSKDTKPSGLFYYHIEDPRLAASLNEITADSISDDMLKAIEKKYRMDGIIINDPSNEQDPSSRGMTSQEFDEFRKDFKEGLRTLCKSLLEGSIAIEPKRTDNTTTACTYCPYGSICFFDPSLPDCHYR